MPMLRRKFRNKLLYKMPVKLYQTTPLPEYPKGKVLWITINHTQFDRFLFKENANPRDGAEVDETILQQTLQKFNVDYRLWKDMTLEEIIKALNDVREEANNEPQKFSGLVIVGMSHGVQIEGHDLMMTRDNELLSTTYVVDLFHNCNCKGFQDKPKAFLFNMCRGTLKNVNIDRLIATSSTICSDVHENTGTTEVSEREFDCNNITFQKADYLIAHSTMSGFVSNRHRLHGSIFIQELTASMNKYMGRGQYHFEDAVRIACSASSFHQRSGQTAPQMPEFITTLRAHFKFEILGK